MIATGTVLLPVYSDNDLGRRSKSQVTFLISGFDGMGFSLWLDHLLLYLDSLNSCVHHSNKFPNYTMKIEFALLIYIAINTV